MDADERRDFEDQDPHIPPTPTSDLGPYARFLQNLPDYNYMTQEKFDKAFEVLPLPTPGPPPPGISYHAAIEASYIHLYTDIIPDVTYNIVPDINIPISYPISYLISYPIFVQAGSVPPLDKEAAAGIITTSEAILKQYASNHSLTASAINDLIKDVLKNPAFNADEVDTDMLQQLQASNDSGDVQTINMHTEGDGEQVLGLFKRPSEKVLR